MGLLASCVDSLNGVELGSVAQAHGSRGTRENKRSGRSMGPPMPEQLLAAAKKCEALGIQRPQAGPAGPHACLEWKGASAGR